MRDRTGSYRVSYSGGPVAHFKRPPGGIGRPLIVSHSPSPSDNGILPLVGSRTGNRLAKLVGLSHAGDLDSIADLANLRDVPTPNADVKGDRAAGERLFDYLNDLFSDGWTIPNRIIAVGRRVWTGLGFTNYEPLHELRIPWGLPNGLRIGTMRFWALPHTSPRNRWYNDPANQQAARELLVKIFDDPSVTSKRRNHAEIE